MIRIFNHLNFALDFYYIKNWDFFDLVDIRRNIDEIFFEDWGADGGARLS